VNECKLALIEFQDGMIFPIAFSGHSGLVPGDVGFHWFYFVFHLGHKLVSQSPTITNKKTIL
jgi:hypothetical protein